MPSKNTRYVAEIDLPIGYLSIECDIEYKDTLVFNFYLNQSSIDREKFLEQNDSEFLVRLLRNKDLVIKTNREDIDEYLNELLMKEFGAGSDILIRDIDLD